MFVIQAGPREKKENLAKMRQAGMIPGVFYGAKKSSVSVSISGKEFKKVWRQAGESSTVVVKTEAGDVDAIIHEVQTDPVTDEPIHVDFLAIDMTKKLKVKVPLEFTGVSEAVKAGLGNLVKVLHEVEVEALPKDLPHSLAADLSKLKTTEDNIFVSDIKLPPEVKIVGSIDEVVASIVLQREEKEEEAAPVDLSAIEVEKKGKKEEEPSAETSASAAPVAEEKVGKKEKK
jgi:large subunit ribosomal protein L25